MTAKRNNPALVLHSDTRTLCSVYVDELAQLGVLGATQLTDPAALSCCLHAVQAVILLKNRTAPYRLSIGEKSNSRKIQLVTKFHTQQ